MVPDWFQLPRFQKEFGSRMGPTFLFFLFAFALAWWSRDLLTDWFALLQVGGRLENGAMRVLLGELPYRDFFFIDTPGSLVLHALAHKLRFHALYLHALAACFSATIVFHWSFGWPRFARLSLALLMLGWSFNLWNTAHPVWLALPFALLGVSAGRSGRWAWAGALFALAFWFQQQIGLFAFLGGAVFLFFRRERWFLTLAFALGTLLPIAAMYWMQPKIVASALGQITWLPTLPLRVLPQQVIGAPLVVLGLWILSLYFLRANPKLRLLSFFAVLIYAGVGWMREGRGFLLGCLFLFSLLIWLAAPLLAVREGGEERRRFLSVWFPAAGFFLLFSGEFPPFLWFLPLASFFLIWSLVRLHAAYARLPRWWLFAPAFALVAGGMVHQYRLLFLNAYASEDAIGRRSYGEVRQVSGEMAIVKDFLISLGAKEGDEVLVLPAAPYFYVFSGFRNPTPFDLANEAPPAHFSQRPTPAAYLDEGGKFVVVEGTVPAFLSGQLREKFTQVLRLQRFSVWRRNEIERAH